MRQINSIKHAELIKLILDVEIIFKNEGRKEECNELIRNRSKLNDIHQEYLLTIFHLEKLVEEYEETSKRIRKLHVSKPMKKLNLKKNQPSSYKQLINYINRFAN